SAARRIASRDDIGGAGATTAVARLPSNDCVGASPNASPSRISPTSALDIRIARFLFGAAGMRHGAVHCRSDLLAVFPQIARRETPLARLPGFLALGQFVGGNLGVECTFDRVDLDDVAVAEQRDRSADSGLRADVANAKTARRTGKASIGD